MAYQPRPQRIESIVTNNLNVLENQEPLIAAEAYTRLCKWLNHVPANRPLIVKLARDKTLYRLGTIIQVGNTQKVRLDVQGGGETYDAPQPIMELRHWLFKDGLTPNAADEAMIQASHKQQLTAGMLEELGKAQTTYEDSVTRLIKVIRDTKEGKLLTGSLAWNLGSIHRAVVEEQMRDHCQRVLGDVKGGRPLLDALKDELRQAEESLLSNRHHFCSTAVYHLMEVEAKREATAAFFNKYSAYIERLEHM